MMNLHTDSQTRAPRPSAGASCFVGRRDEDGNGWGCYNPAMSRELKQHLFKVYKGFSDKRIKKLDKGETFIVDNREHEAMNMAFCSIFANVTGQDEIKLIFHGNLPHNETVKKLIESKGGTLKEVGYETRAVVGPITLGDIGFIEKLRAAIKGVTSKPYTEKSWKYSAVRVSDSLGRLIDALEAYRDKRPEPEEEPDPTDDRPF